MSDETTDQRMESEHGTRLRNKIAFGMDVKVFIASQVGRYLLDKANKDRDAAMEELANVDAEDAKAIRALQNRVKCTENFLMWLGEAVTEGEIAEQELIAGD